MLRFFSGGSLTSIKDVDFKLQRSFFRNTALPFRKGENAEVQNIFIAKRRLLCEEGYGMKAKILVVAITLSLLFTVMWTAVGGEAKEEDIRIEEEEVEITEDLWEFFEVELIDYDEEVRVGDEINIEYRVKNTGGATGIQDVVLSVEGERVDREEVNRDEDLILEPDEEWKNEVTYDTRDVDVSTAQIEFSTELSLLLNSNNDSHSGKVTVTEPMIDIPGFTSILLLLSIVTSLAIYKKMKR